MKKRKLLSLTILSWQTQIIAIAIPGHIDSYMAYRVNSVSEAASKELRVLTGDALLIRRGCDRTDF